MSLSSIESAAYEEGFSLAKLSALPDGKSALMLGMPFALWRAYPPDTARVSAFYFTMQKAYLAEKRLAARLGLPTDTHLPRKAYGALAGLGTMGDNALLHIEKGCAVALAMLILPDESAPEPEFPSVCACTHCGACHQACPVGALDRSGRVDRTLCLRAHMINGELTPDPLRIAMGTRLIGCDECMAACASTPIEEPDPELLSCFTWDILLDPVKLKAALPRIGELIGTNYARQTRLLAQAALAVGNSGLPRYVPLLQKLLQHPSPAVSEHAAWSIRRLENG